MEGYVIIIWRKKVLIKSVKQSIPIYILSAMIPPKTVLKELQRIFSSFFWQTKEIQWNKHRATYSKISFPKEERGLGFRSILDVSKEMHAKLW